ncbi:unnamed protein product [Rhizophagus irregularis]|nr:unnamed protein product [Rhizophagus irregularis]
MGFLEGSLDGTLQLKDQTGTISAINISFEKIQSHHLNSIWIIPEYELVVERPSKIYLRFAIEKCFCFTRNHMIRKFILIEVIEFDDSSTFKDLFGQVIQPKILRLNDSSKNSFRNLKAAFLTEDKALNVQEFLNGNLLTF